MKRFGGLVLAFGVTGLAFFLGCADGEKVDPAGYLAGTVPAQKDAGGATEDLPKSKKVKGISDDKGTPKPSGDDDDDNTSSSSGAASSSGGSSSGGSSSTSSGGSSSSSGSTTPPPSSSSSSSSTSSSGGSSSSSSSSGSTPPPPPPPPGPTSCDTTTICTTGSGSLDAGYVSGDTGSDVKTATGYTSYWVKVTVGEDSWSAIDLRMRATLTSPPGENFDLFIHADSCNTATAKSEKPAGQDDVAGIIIPDNLGGDDQWVLIEIRHVGPEQCDSSAKWTLKIEGNK